MNKKNSILDIFLWILRIAVGGLFIFSGLVKANDPKGLAYKMGEFFEAWAGKDNFLPDLMHMLNEYALPFAVIMIVLEIVAGVALIIGFRFKLFSWIIFLLTAFFTFLTAYVLFSGNIKACGCFGDCIPLTPQETFTKDIILMVLITILLIFRNRIKPLMSAKWGTFEMIGVTALSLFLMLYVLRNLPVKDCLAYAVGNNIQDEMTPADDYQPEERMSYFYYKNLKTGERQEFAQDKMPWQDTLTWAYDTLAREVIVSPAVNEPRIKDFSISSMDGIDRTQDILNFPEDIMLVFIRNLEDANLGKIDDLRKLIVDCKTKGIPILGLTSDNAEMVSAFKSKHKLALEFYNIDGTEAKTAIRTNPGFMSLKGGTITGKWGFGSTPKLSDLNMSTTGIPVFSEVIEEEFDEEFEEDFEEEAQ